jgi:hypothetical protein
MFLRVLVAVAAILFPTLLFAHSGTGPHGGVTTDAGAYLVEVVAAGGQLKVFLFNDKTEKPEPAKAAKGTATVLVGQQRETVALQPDDAAKDGNLLTGKLSLTPGPGARIVVQLQLPGQAAVVARFSL